MGLYNSARGKWDSIAARRNADRELVRASHLQDPNYSPGFFELHSGLRKVRNAAIGFVAVSALIGAAREGAFGILGRNTGKATGELATGAGELVDGAGELTSEFTDEVSRNGTCIENSVIRLGNCDGGSSGGTNTGNQSDNGNLPVVEIGGGGGQGSGAGSGELIPFDVARSAGVSGIIKFCFGQVTDYQNYSQWPPIAEANQGLFTPDWQNPDIHESDWQGGNQPVCS